MVVILDAMISMRLWLCCIREHTPNPGLPLKPSSDSFDPDPNAVAGHQHSRKLEYEHSGLISQTWKASWEGVVWTGFQVRCIYTLDTPTQEIWSIERVEIWLATFLYMFNISCARYSSVSQHSCKTLSQWYSALMSLTSCFFQSWQF